MQIFKKAVAAFRARRKWRLDELSDWVVAPLGAASFLIAGYWGMAVGDVLPELVSVTNRHGLSWFGAAAFVLLGMMGVTIWFHAHLAARCNAVLKQRHFSW
ncbi:hypothetical protein SAMN05216588_107147 [Pseudomonas flavescens]|uniref:Uncharacterized protein n=1 Tax=Phytopseudomonas flavescens TaxID=29435 RepID=A0A1G8F642_9GAMM|nr:MULTISPECIES: hypothetical protein [Gammaproteobacteria]PPT52211.1 hypothetical protein XarjCFBP7652_01645 [Xanthomonas arboricola]SDH77584.1 hypothetical protein SAMN05216588_107147 [Pseudomonas flavescens]